MIEYILDTDICIYWFKGMQEVKRKVEEIGPDKLGITIFTLAELKYGAYYSHKIEENLENIKSFSKMVKTIDFDSDSADIFGKLKSELRRKGELIEDFDTLIASIVLKYGKVLVTNNADHFKRIPGLVVENWLG